MSRSFSERANAIAQGLGLKDGRGAALAFTEPASERGRATARARLLEALQACRPTAKAPSVASVIDGLVAQAVAKAPRTKARHGLAELHELVTHSGPSVTKKNERARLFGDLLALYDLDVAFGFVDLTAPVVDSLKTAKAVEAWLRDAR